MTLVELLGRTRAAVWLPPGWVDDWAEALVDRQCGLSYEDALAIVDWCIAQEARRWHARRGLPS